jgi:arginine decarboxylase
LSTRSARKRRTKRPMEISQAEETYGIHRWGAGYFSVGDSGLLRVHPTKQPDVWVDLMDVLLRMRRRRARTPFVLRFPQMIDKQVSELHDAFSRAIAEFGYDGAYRGVFPVKVNQMQPFIQGLVDSASAHGHGLEAGTKPELAMVLASGLPVGSLVICNGYKDAGYVDLALSGVTLGYQVVVVVEKFHELGLVMKRAKRAGVRPLIGLRLKVHARGTGKWARSGGEGSKFGLTTYELLEAVEEMRRQGWLDQLKLLHLHIGSQITDIRRIKKGVLEGARFYASLRERGVDLQLLDVGGGLGVDYDGSRTASDSSVNYSVQEYANDVVWNVKEVCEGAGVPMPDIVTESGRALSAYHAMTIFAVDETQTKSVQVPLPDLPEDADRTVLDLLATKSEVSPKNFMECFHDTLALVEQLHMLFNLGQLSIEERAIGEATAAQIYRDVLYFAKTSGRRMPEEIEELEKDCAEKYVCNLSIFQSMPDSWAIGQLFPICPIHRLDESPTVWATLCDITCDSDGKIDKFGDVREDQDAIRLHELDGNRYYLGAFLLGAYQDVMGNFHNLLGETDEAEVVVEGAGEARVTLGRCRGQTTIEVLEQFGHRRREMRSRFLERLEAAAEEGNVPEEERLRAFRAFRSAMNGRPYLSPTRRS